MMVVVVVAAVRRVVCLCAGILVCYVFTKMDVGDMAVQFSVSIARGIKTGGGYSQWKLLYTSVIPRRFPTVG